MPFSIESAIIGFSVDRVAVVTCLTLVRRNCKQNQKRRVRFSNVGSFFINPTEGAHGAARYLPPVGIRKLAGSGGTTAFSECGVPSGIQL